MRNRGLLQLENHYCVFRYEEKQMNRPAHVERAIHREAEEERRRRDRTRVSAIMFAQLDILLGVGARFYCSFIVCRGERLVY